MRKGKKVVAGVLLSAALLATAYGVVLPWRASAWARAAEAKAAVGANEEALADCAHALELDGRLSRALALRGYLRTFTRKEPVSGERDVQRAAALDPDDAFVAACRAQVWVGLERYAEGLEEARRATALDPHSADAWGALGAALGAVLDPEAIPALDRALRLRPFDPIRAIERSVALEEIGRTRESLEEAERAVELAPHLSIAYAARAGRWIHRGRPRKAIEDASRAVAIDRSPDGRSALARARIDLSHLEEAVAECDDLLKAHPEYISALLLRASARLGQGRNEEAHGDAERALALNPKSTSALLIRASAFHRMGRREEARRDWAAAEALHPRPIGVLLGRAGQLSETGEMEEAGKDYDRACALQPEGIVPLLSRAYFKTASGDVDGAVADSTRVLRELDPTSVSACLARAHARVWKNTEEALLEALKDCDEAQRLDPEGGESLRLRANAWQLLAEHRGLRGDEAGKRAALDQAIEAADRAVNGNPESPFNYTFRASVHVARGDTASAAKDARKALDRAPWFVDAHVSLAEVKLLGKEYGAARKECENALAKNRSYFKARRMMGFIDYKEADALLSANKRDPRVEPLLESSLAHYRKAGALVVGTLAEQTDRDLASVESLRDVLRASIRVDDAVERSRRTGPDEDVVRLLRSARELLTKAEPGAPPGTPLRKSWTDLDEFLKRHGY